MKTAAAVAPANVTPLNFISADASQSSIEGLIAAVFANPDRPTFKREGAITYTSDALEAPVNSVEGWKSGKYITFSRYVDSSNPSVPVHYHVSGTGPNGEYIPPHQVDARGNVTLNAGPPSEFKIREEQKMRALLDLRSGGTDEQGRTYYTREGFSGRYYLQAEQDGQISVHYTGGMHASSVSLPPQTFVNGKWDVTRREPLGGPGPLSLPGPIVAAPSRRRFS